MQYNMVYIKATKTNLYPKIYQIHLHELGQRLQLKVHESTTYQKMQNHIECIHRNLIN